MIRIFAVAVGVVVFACTALFSAPPALAQKSDKPYSGSSKSSPNDRGSRKSFKNDDGQDGGSGGSKFDAPTNNRKSFSDDQPQSSPDDQEDPRDPDQDGQDSEPQNETPPDNDQKSPDREENPEAQNEGIDTSLGGKKSWSVEPDQPDNGNDMREPDQTPETPGRPSIKDLDDGSSIDA